MEKGEERLRGDSGQNGVGECCVKIVLKNWDILKCTLGVWDELMINYNNIHVRDDVVVTDEDTIRIILKCEVE
jgi:hypothetical protein